MAKILISPKNGSFPAFEMEGRLTCKVIDGLVVYFIAGHSFPGEIVTIVICAGDEET